MCLCVVKKELPSTESAHLHSYCTIVILLVQQRRTVLR